MLRKEDVSSIRFTELKGMVKECLTPTNLPPAKRLGLGIVAKVSGLVSVVSNQSGIS